jgi:hypothetical protein
MSWSPEQKARQSAAIHRWKPWERSTGPRTAEGKSKASRNAYKGGLRPQLAALRRLVNEHLRANRETLAGLR